MELFLWLEGPGELSSYDRDLLRGRPGPGCLLTVDGASNIGISVSDALHLGCSEPWNGATLWFLVTSAYK